MLNAKQQKALECLLICRTQEEAAKLAGCTTRTLRTYLADKEFSAEYKKAYDSIFEDAARSAERAINPALQVLEEISKNPEAPWMARVSASINLIKYGRELRETNDIVQRIGALENAVQQQNH